MKSSRPAIAVLAAAMALTVSLTGCADKSSTSNGAGASTAISMSDADTATLLKDASEASKKVTTVNFAVEVTGKVPGLPVTKVDGGLQVKPTTQAQGTARIEPGNAEAKFSFIDGTMFAALYGNDYSDYGDGRSIYDVAALFDPAKGLPFILTQVTGAKAVGAETINNQETVKIVGTVPAKDLAPITGTSIDPAKSGPVPTTLWVQRSGDKQLVRISVAPSTEGSITLTFSKWGEPVSVTKPTVKPAETVTNPGPGQKLGNK